MKRNSTPSKFGNEDPLLSTIHEDSKCGACGEEFKTPLLAKIFLDSLIEDYYACPKCLSKNSNLVRQKPVEVEEDQKEKVEAPLETEPEDAEGGTTSCAYYLGYLKKRQKDTPIPEDCLTCSKMIECMY